MANKKTNTKKSNNSKKNTPKTNSSKNNNKSPKNIKKTKNSSVKKTTPKKTNNSIKKTSKKENKIKKANEVKKQVTTKNVVLPKRKEELNNSKPKELEVKKNIFTKEKVMAIINRFNRRKLIKISIICLILALLLIVPYGKRIYKSEASGKFLEVPKFSKLREECCNYSATFSSIRSYASLKVDLKKIVKSYEKLDCDGVNYYYNKDEDYTITDFGVKRGLIFNTFYITYGEGNSCEIDTSLKSLDLLSDDYSISDAKKDGSYIIIDDEVINASSYDNFLKNVADNNPSTLRIVTTNTDGDVIITDLEYLSDGNFKVTYDDTRDRNSKNNNSIIAYKYEHIGIYKEKLYAYNGSKITKSMLGTEDVYYLFDVK
jgi:hypothetical protein